MARFSYYRRLSRRQKAIYRRSDEITDVPLPDRTAVRPDAVALREALERGDRVAVEHAAVRLVLRVLAQLEAPPLSVRVLAVRPRSASSELHGLYTHEEGRRPLVQVWMKTAAHRRVVAFRTFLRTLMHEVCHHLDYTLFGLGDSFHNEGFFRRESSLVRQIAGASRRGRSTSARSGMQETNSTRSKRSRSASAATVGSSAASAKGADAAPRSARAGSGDRADAGSGTGRDASAGGSGGGSAGAASGASADGSARSDGGTSGPAQGSGTGRRSGKRGKKGRAQQMELPFGELGG